MQVPNSDDFMERVMEPKTRYRPPRNDQEGFLGLERFAISTTHSQFKMATPEEKKHMMEYQCKKIQETQQKLDLFIEPLVKIDRQIEELWKQQKEIDDQMDPLFDELRKHKDMDYMIERGQIYSENQYNSIFINNLNEYRRKKAYDKTHTVRGC